MVDTKKRIDELETLINHLDTWRKNLIKELEYLKNDL
jgi:hypothetical protein